MKKVSHSTQYLANCKRRFTLANDIVKELDENLTEGSDDFKVAVLYVLMNWSKSYFDLRKTLTSDYSYRFIQKHKKAFTNKAIKCGYLDELCQQAICQEMISLGFFLNVLWIDGTIKRVKIDNEDAWQINK